MVNDTLRSALKKYGIEHQTLMLCEECGELIQAANKALRYGIDSTRAQLTEEMADVLVMIEQIRMYYGISWVAVNDMYCNKVDRLNERMKGDLNGRE